MCAFTSYATYKQPLVQAHVLAVYENTINHWMAYWNICMYLIDVMQSCNMDIIILMLNCCSSTLCTLYKQQNKYNKTMTTIF